MKTKASGTVGKQKIPGRPKVCTQGLEWGRRPRFGGSDRVYCDCLTAGKGRASQHERGDVSRERASSSK